MSDVIQCKKCVMDSIADPDFTVDDKGVCNYCRFAESKMKERKLARLQLPWIIHRIKQQGRGKKYDCLIGLSGGVDSSYALLKIKEQGLRPLAFSVDNGWNTPQSDENIMRLVEGLQVPFYRYTINLKAFRGLQRAFIEAGVINIEIPTDHILMAATYDMARKYGIKTIISGGNWQTEGTMPKAFSYSARDLTHIKAIAKEYGATIKGLPTISLLQYLRYRNMEGIKIINILDYYDYNRQRAIELLKEKYGWKEYGEKHGESTFTKWFQEYWLPGKWNIDKRKPHLSSCIHSGQMTREQAMKQLEMSLPPLREDSFAPIFKTLGLIDGVITWKEHAEYPTNEKWEARWSRFFTFLKRHGYRG